MSCQLGNDGSYAGANGYMQYQASITGGAKGILKISYKNNIETIYFNDVLKLTLSHNPHLPSDILLAGM